MGKEAAPHKGEGITRGRGGEGEQRGGDALLLELDHTCCWGSITRAVGVRYQNVPVFWVSVAWCSESDT